MLTYDVSGCVRCKNSSWCPKQHNEGKMYCYYQPELAVIQSQLLPETVELTELVPLPYGSMHPEPTWALSLQLLTSPLQVESSDGVNFRCERQILSVSNFICCTTNEVVVAFAANTALELNETRRLQGGPSGKNCVLAGGDVADLG